MRKDVFPHSIATLTEYIQMTLQKTSANMGAYGMSPAKPEAVAPHPDTAAEGQRDARNAARGMSEKARQHFPNKNIPYNAPVGVTGLEVFGIRPQGRMRRSVFGM
ncbi:MAG: hypothetical protein LBP98_04355 [Tannerella sp.]|jgi:hypothetical protein|nr:hypothetical protein [Tannerella sp.]